MIAQPGGPRRRGARIARDIRRRILSQNLLKGPAAVDEFLSHVPVGQADLCVEVGAGDGAITERLAARCRAVVAYEIDPCLAARLRTRLRERVNTEIVVRDFRNAPPPDEPFHLIGNVPFSITSSIVDWTLRAPTLMAATLITQLEYARKRSGAYGRWTLVTVRSWPEFGWELRATLSRFQFRPVPTVDAGVLHLWRRSTLLVPAAARARYEHLVELGFGGVGGSLYASLRHEYPVVRLNSAFAAAGIDRSAVVAFVHPDQWVTLFRQLETRPGLQARRPAGRTGSR